VRPEGRAHRGDRIRKGRTKPVSSCQAALLRLAKPRGVVYHCKKNLSSTFSVTHHWWDSFGFALLVLFCARGSTLCANNDAADRCNKLLLSCELVGSSTVTAGLSRSATMIIAPPPPCQSSIKQMPQRFCFQGILDTPRDFAAHRPCSPGIYRRSDLPKRPLTLGELEKPNRRPS